MPIIITGTKNGLHIYNPDREAKTGRWCKAPQIPDLCYKCFDPETLAHYAAEGFREEKAADGTIWRYGTCHRCQKGKGLSEKGG